MLLLLLCLLLLLFSIFFHRWFLSLSLSLSSCVYTIWFDLFWFDVTSLHLIWLDSYCSYSFGMVVRAILIYFILSYLILSYLTLLHLILFILNYYIILWYMYINIWYDTQCCWLTNNMYYYSIMILISGWLDSFISCCSGRLCGSCKAPTWERS